MKKSIIETHIGIQMPIREKEIVLSCVKCGSTNVTIEATHDPLVTKLICHNKACGIKERSDKAFNFWKTIGFIGLLFFVVMIASLIF